VEHGEETLAQVAIRFVLAKKEASMVLVGLSSSEQVDEAAACSGRPGLSPEQMEKVKHIYHAD